jgi:hypothetical protein
MPDTGDRMTRAGNYVLGLMNDSERERAERDLETDASFRDAVVEVAERMHVFDHRPAPEKVTDDSWKKIKERIDGMPQMRNVVPAESPVAPSSSVNFGRRRSDPQRETLVPTAPSKTTWIGAHSVPGRWAMVMALCLAAAFALGYVTGASSVWTVSVADRP